MLFKCSNPCFTDFKENEKYAVLDFCALSNPIVLLHSLINSFAAGYKLIVEEALVRCVYQEWPWEIDCGVAPNTWDLRDPGILIAFKSKDWRFNLSMNNMASAIEVFQRAVRLGYIKVVELDRDLVSAAIEIGEQELSEEGIFWGTDVVHFENYSVGPDWPTAAGINELLALQTGGLIISDSINISGSRSLLETNSTIVFDEVVDDLLRIAQPKSVDDAFKLVESSTVMPAIIDSTINILKDRKYKDDLKLFLPEWIADHVTLGLYSAAKMGIKIFRGKKEKSKN